MALNIIFTISLLCLCTHLLSGQIVTEKLLVSLEDPNCDGVEEDQECLLLAQKLLTEMTQVFLPMIEKNERNVLIEIVDEVYPGPDGNGMKEPVTEIVIFFKLTSKSIAATVNEIKTAPQPKAQIASVNWQRKGKSPRKQISEMAREIIRQVFNNLYQKSLGSTSQFLLRLPGNESIDITDSKEWRGRWKELSFVGKGNYPSIPAVVGQDTTGVLPPDVLGGNTYLEWRVREQGEGVSMKPFRYALNFSTGVIQTEDKFKTTSRLFVSLLVSPKITLHIGGAHFILPQTTQVQPLPGVLAKPRIWWEDKFIPLLGVGYRFRDPQLGLRYGFDVEGFPSPLYLGAAAWVAPDRLSWLRLWGGFYRYTTDVETRLFKVDGTVSDLSLIKRTYTFPSAGLSVHLPL